MRKEFCPCCNAEMVWVDYGPKLQYWYCRDCKDELDKLLEKKYSSHDADIERMYGDYDSRRFPDDMF